MISKFQRLMFLAIMVLSTSVYSTSGLADEPNEVMAEDEEAQPAAPVADPYERFNRAMFKFNDTVDHLILKPVATLYSKIVPKPLLKGISNFFSNVDTVPTVINDVLQFNFYQATSDGWRLLLNTTIGIGGLFDVASPMGLERNAEDFGLTLARWGYQNSNYLVIPFLGPSTVRDTIAWPINYQYMTIYPWVHPTRARYGLFGLNVISKRADYLRFQDVMKQAAIDKYVFVRDAYMQRRSYQIERNKQLGDPYMEKNSLIDKDNYIKTDDKAS